MKPYYYVYKVGGNAPKYKHKTRLKAQTEAERLAVKHPGDHFEILSCVGISSTPAPKVSTFWLDGESPTDGEVELPFPEDFPELPPLPEGYSRWVYRGRFGKIACGRGRSCKDREVKYFAAGNWYEAENFDGPLHHIEAI